LQRQRETEDELRKRIAEEKRRKEEARAKAERDYRVHIGGRTVIPTAGISENGGPTHWFPVEVGD
jgi:hypothetical protein